MLQHIYFISGLGADKKVFSKLRFDPSIHLHHIQWIEPLYNETLRTYCIRLSEQVKETENSIIIGLSFGGMVAQELSKIIPFQKVILISSIKSHTEIPYYFRWFAKIGLHHLIPYSLSRFGLPVINWFFSATGVEEKELLKVYLNRTSVRYLKWAINTVLTYTDFENKNTSIYHVHGQSDRLLPFKYIKNAIAIHHAGHLAVYTQYQEVNAVISGFMGD
jgi:pimeloyl-ACP methyl ester carboxylesterase